MNAIGEEARGNHHQRRAGHIKEGAQVEAESSAEDQHADSGGNQQADHGAKDDGESLTRRCSGLAEQEERRFNSLADYRGEGEKAQTKHRR